MKDSFGIKKQMSLTGPIRNLIISFSREIKDNDLEILVFLMDMYYFLSIISSNVVHVE